MIRVSPAQRDAEKPWNTSPDVPAASAESNHPNRSRGTLQQFDSAPRLLVRDLPANGQVGENRVENRAIFEVRRSTP